MRRVLFVWVPENLNRGHFEKRAKELAFGKRLASSVQPDWKCAHARGIRVVGNSRARGVAWAAVQLALPGGMGFMIDHGLMAGDVSPWRCL